MIPHHQQAVQMADMALTSATSSAVERLAADIKAAQAPEIATMTSWLQARGEPVPDASMDAGMSGMDHGSGSGMTGMMTPEEMHQLEESTGRAFDLRWTRMMIEHHRGATTMAKTELATMRELIPTLGG